MVGCVFRTAPNSTINPTDDLVIWEGRHPLFFGVLGGGIEILCLRPPKNAENLPGSFDNPFDVGREGEGNVSKQ